MSVIRRLRKGSRSIRVHPTNGDCEYQFLIDGSGARFIQLSTFGSEDRQDKGTVSQTMQFDADRARELATIILKNM